jgi:chorismate mutase
MVHGDGSRRIGEITSPSGTSAEIAYLDFVPLKAGACEGRWPMSEEMPDKNVEIPESVLDRLEELRASIDNIDAALVHVLAERFKCTRQVGRLKAAHGLPPADKAREAAQIERLEKLAGDAQLDPEFAKKFMAFIIQEVIRHHEGEARGFQ